MLIINIMSPIYIYSESNSSESDKYQSNDYTFQIKDIHDFEWAAEASYCILSILMQGFLTEIAQEFNLKENVDRATFVMTLLRADIIDLSSYANNIMCSFSDVSKSDYFYTYIAISQGAALVAGDENNCFYPMNDMSRQDAAVILYRYLELLHPEEIEFVNKQSFSDDDSISEYAREAVYKLQALGIIVGSDNEFKPEEGINIAEMCCMLYRMLQYVDGTL